MHIKEVQIGLEQADLLAPKLNYVGDNGLVNTNLISDICFVLGDLIQNQNSEDRHKPPPDGAGQPFLSRFVEIVFDNSDRCLMVDKEEVHLCRMTDLEKDEYLLDGKRITKVEVKNLLESAGFSRSNPYYLVHQKNLESLKLMGDSGLLNLLKEIGGSWVEAIYSEILEKMHETGKEINGAVEMVDKRLRKLVEESKGLKKFQVNEELQAAKAKLATVQRNLKNFSESSQKHYDEVLEYREDSKKLDKELTDIEKNIQLLEKQKEQKEKKQTQAMKDQRELEFDLNDLQMKISGEEVAVSQLNAFLEEISKKIEELQETSGPDGKEAMNAKNVKTRIEERGKDCINPYKGQDLPSNEVQKLKLTAEIDELEREIREQRTYIENLTSTAADSRALISQLSDENKLHKENQDNLQTKQVSLWRNKEMLTTKVDELKAEVEKGNKSLYDATPYDIRRGHRYIPRICKELNISAGSDQLIDSITCDEKFFSAVEVTAGNSLFNVVVEDDACTNIIGHLLNHKRGRVTFIPLEKVNGLKATDLPGTSSVEPLTKKLKFASHNDAFKQVFARTVICKDMDVASQLSQTRGLDCITIEGDHVSNKGGMTGGFFDSQFSKLKLASKIRETRELILKEEKALREATEVLRDIDKNIANLVTTQQKVDAMLSHEHSKFKELNQDIANAKYLLPVLENLRNSLKMYAEKCQYSDEETEEPMGAHTYIFLLNQQKEELEAIVNAFRPAVVPNEAESKQQELKDAELFVGRMTEEFKSVTKSIDDEREKLERIKGQKREMKETEDACVKKFLEETEKLKKLCSTRSLVQENQKYWLLQEKELEPLSLEPVNKEILNLYLKFTAKLKELQTRQDELSEDSQIIKEFISFLDKKKDRSIEDTLQGVSDAFSLVFQKGDYHLVMMNEPQQDGDHADDSHRVEKYIGVKVKVKGQTLSLIQLPESKKNAVALALIFAIQHYGHAPFYLFDRIDAKLDPEDLTDVGDIYKVFDHRGAQIIATKFWKELLSKPESEEVIFYGDGDEVVEIGDDGDASKKVFEVVDDGLNSPTNTYFTDAEKERFRSSFEFAYEDRNKILAFSHDASIYVTAKEFASLKPGGWLNTEIIDYYLHLLGERQIREGFPRKCYFFSSFFYMQVRQAATYRLSGWGCDKDILEYDRVFVPIHHPDLLHWCLVVIIHGHTLEFRYLDSFLGEDHKVLEDLAGFYEEHIVRDKFSWIPKFPKDIPQQTNGCDCGMFVLKYVDYCCRDLSLTFTQADIPKFRTQIAQEILDGKAN